MAWRARIRPQSLRGGEDFIEAFIIHIKRIRSVTID